jgi:hypothetical protein
MRRTIILEMKPAGNPWVPANPMGYRFGQNFKPVIGTGFLMDIDNFHGYRFGMAKLSGFVLVAISRLDTLQSSRFFSFSFL